MRVAHLTNLPLLQLMSAKCKRCDGVGATTRDTVLRLGCHECLATEAAEDINHVFWQQFSDPIRAYYNYMPVYRGFVDNPDRKKPHPDCADFIHLAYQYANEK